MRKPDVLRSITAKVPGISQDKADAVLNAFVETVFEAIEKDPEDTILLKGMGIFRTKKHEAKKGYSYMLKKEWESKPYYELIFNVSKDVKKFEIEE